MIDLKQRTLAHLCLASSEKYKNKPAFSMFSDGKIIRQITYAQMGRLSIQTARQLKKMGIQSGDKVMLLAENCPEWPIAYFGIALAGAVSVPLLTGFSNEQIDHIAEHSGVSAICISSLMYEKYNPKTQNLLFIDTLLDDEKIHANDFDFYKQGEDDLASIIYTSGTQGNSKGVMLSGKNIISSTVSSHSYVKIKPQDRMLSVLPLAHSYECGLGLLAPVLSGASITYLDKPPSPSIMLPALKTLRPTAMVTVPLLIEKIYRTSIEPKLNASRLYRFPLTKPLAIRAAGRKLYSALGGKLHFFGIGGAPLSPKVEEFLYRAKFPYSIGYGLTEAAPLVAGNAPRRFKLNTGVSAAKGVSLRISNGEIQAKGPNIMLGYYNDMEKTRETITPDGWLRTGDLGFINKKNRLYIKGRLKALILGPSGENIYPEEIEDLLGSSQLVEESLVYAGNKGEIVALVRLSEAAKAAADATMHALDELKAWVNKKLSSFSRINKIVVIDRPFEKTPTMKIKRYLYI